MSPLCKSSTDHLQYTIPSWTIWWLSIQHVPQKHVANTFGVTRKLTGTEFEQYSWVAGRFPLFLADGDNYISHQRSIICFWLNTHWVSVGSCKVASRGCTVRSSKGTLHFAQLSQFTCSWVILWNQLSQYISQPLSLYFALCTIFLNLLVHGWFCDTKSSPLAFQGISVSIQKVESWTA